MVWLVLRYWITFFFPSFYKRIGSKNLNTLRLKGPAIIAMNHPNAFTDPVGLTYLVHPLRPKFLARGDAFKPGLMTWFLESIGIIPIFRIQDGGKEGLKKNEDAYRRVNHYLRKNAKVMVFAEGLCIQERRLRPLKKGVARMVFGAWEAIQNENMVVIPVGVNYSQPDKFRSDLFYNVGEPIPVKDLIPAYKENPARAQNTFLQLLEPKMKGLITHINDPADDQAVYQVEILYKRDRIKQLGLDPANAVHDFEVLKELTEKVNKASKDNKTALDEFKNEASAYFELLKKNGLRDWLIHPSAQKKISWGNLLFRILLLVLGFPLYLIGFVTNYPAFKLTDVVTWKLIKNKEFYSSIAIGVGMVLFFLNYLIWAALIWILSGSLFIAYCACIVFGLASWFNLYYRPYSKKTLGILRILKNPSLFLELKNRREKLLSLINKF